MLGKNTASWDLAGKINHSLVAVVDEVFDVFGCAGEFSALADAAVLLVGCIWGVFSWRLGVEVSY
jgi:hypothetical protein